MDVILIIKQTMNGGMEMSSYKEYKKRALQNLDVKVEYDALQPEYDMIQSMMDVRVQQDMILKVINQDKNYKEGDKPY